MRQNRAEINPGNLCTAGHLRERLWRFPKSVDRRYAFGCMTAPRSSSSDLLWFPALCNACKNPEIVSGLR
ncbi:MAG: hypothetical protein OXG16_04060 [Rhodospirillales bacterium]|nr:hypothetical protein [Rhodospirillales bacterium]